MARIFEDDKCVMSKQILLIFDPANQRHLVSNLLLQMRKRGLEIDAFNSYRWEYVDTEKEIPFLYRVLRRLLFIRKVGTLVRYLFQTRLLVKISGPYSLVDIHFFWRSFIPFLKKINKPYKITIWGSDFYREKPEIQEIKKRLYEKAVVVQAETKETCDDVLNYDPNLHGKVEACNFGVDILETMSQLPIGCLISPRELGNRIIVALGYNGSKGQQHELMIKAIDALPLEYKEKLFLYIPATYGLQSDYEATLITLLDKLGIPYHIFNHRLSEAELAQLRRDSNIAINAQITDTLNASLLQHLYTGGIVIVGDWLKYGIYDRHNIVYYKSEKDAFTETIKYCLDNYEEIKELVKHNKERVLEFATWDAVSDRQFEIFKKFIAQS